VPLLADSLSGARLASELREYAGQLGSLFIPALARQQPFTSSERDAIQRVSGRIEVLRDQIELRVAVPGQAPAVRAAHETMKDAYFLAGRQLLDRTIATGVEAGDFGMDPAAFTALYVPRMNAIVGLRDALLDDARVVATKNRDAARALLLVVLAGAAGLVAVLAASIWLLHVRVLGPLEQTTRALHALARGDHDAPLPKPRTGDEIAEVVGAVMALRRHSRERVALERERDQLIVQLRDQSGTDFLTGLQNRRAFVPSAQREIALSRRHGFGVAAVVLDIDHFKQVNDTHGHAVGDLVLTRLAATLRGLLREGDLLARFGGEEFVVLLSQCDLVAGALFAQRVCEAVAAMPVQREGLPDLRVTASLGVAESRKGAELDLDTLLQRADQAMYRAKQSGRNRVEVHDG
jgi:diguanylate cyclase (GGDEF)-like protein